MREIETRRVEHPTENIVSPKRFVQIGKSKTPIDKLIEENTCCQTGQSILLCQRVADGIIQAKCEESDDSLYPGLDIFLHTESGDIPLVRIEEPVANEDSEHPPLQVIVYGPYGDYVAIYEPLTESEHDPAGTKMLVSGDPGARLSVAVENQYVMVNRNTSKEE